MRFFLMAALMCAVAPLCAQSSIVIPFNAPIGLGQERAVVLEYQSPVQPPPPPVVPPPAPVTWAVDFTLDVSSSAASGAHVTLYSPVDEYQNAQWQGSAPGSCTAATAGAGQAQASHTTTPLNGFHRFVLIAREHPGMATGTLACTITISCDVGTLTQGATVGAVTGTGLQATGFLFTTGTPLIVSPDYVIDLVLDGASGNEAVSLAMSLNNVDVTFSDITGGASVAIGSWSASGGSGSGGAYSTRGLEQGQRSWRIKVRRTGASGFFGIELRVSGGARIAGSTITVPPAPVNPGQHYTSGSGGAGGGGGGCAAGIGATATIPLVAMLVMALRRRRAA